MTEPKITDRSIERIVSWILRSGVLISGTVVSPRRHRFPGETWAGRS